MYQITDAYFAERQERWFFSGHTHVQGLVELPSGKCYCNPGSVGQPRDGDPAAAFAIFDTVSREITWCRVPYDVDTAAARIRDNGLPPSLADRLFVGR